ncbi:hypothetical protein V6N11_012857 [Hibiscus sabdariffa]|uniref:Uncharacterized protein n=2 Tax=Hibiscus sabdariffa TaxID=183260 RepID=A0ABR2EGM6_9ROSI
MLATAASLYPLYVTVGGIVACFEPSAFAWFVQRGPSSYSFSLGFIMLAMGLTLEFKDLLNLFIQRPLSVSSSSSHLCQWALVHPCTLPVGLHAEDLSPSGAPPDMQHIVYTSILLGCIAQYSIMPTFAMVISRTLGLSPSLSVGLILLGCCPGGAASNAVTFIARGDVPLSTVLTVCTTFGAVILTPVLTKILAGTYVPVDAIGLSLSTLQVVVTPVLLGSYIQSSFPSVVRIITPFAPLFAVLTSSLLACSVFSENVVRFKSSMVDASLASDTSLVTRLQSILSGDLGAVILSVLLLHCAGFFVGYILAAICRFREPERRAISIEVGMQNSSLGVVLAASHFTSPMVALPPAMSAVIMNIMGSSLGFFWRHMGGSKQELDDHQD